MKSNINVPYLQETQFRLYIFVHCCLNIKRHAIKSSRFLFQTWYAAQISVTDLLQPFLIKYDTLEQAQTYKEALQLFLGLYSLIFGVYRPGSASNI